MTLPIVVLGAGGHGKVVADILLAANAVVAGFLDDQKSAGETVLGLPILGGLRWLESNRARVVLGIGSNETRARLAERALATGSSLMTAIHPSAVLARSCTVEEGIVVMANATVNPDAFIGRGAIINTGAVIEHDCAVGSFAHISPRAALAGGCRVGAFAHVGIGVAMLPGTTVGERAIVGGGGLVARNIPAGSIARGVPARVTRKIDASG